MQSYDQLETLIMTSSILRVLKSCQSYAWISVHSMSTDVDTNFDCSNPICKCGRGIEDNKHFLLHFQQYKLLRRDLFHQLTISGIDINGMDTNMQCNLLLFGRNDLNKIQNRTTIEAKISFIEATKRLD